jgi:hypothetical protein
MQRRARPSALRLFQQRGFLPRRHRIIRISSGRAGNTVPQASWPRRQNRVAVEKPQGWIESLAPHFLLEAVASWHHTARLEGASPFGMAA